MDWQVIGHEWAAEMLQQQIVNALVRHAYLLCGVSGIGRRTLALRFAQALNCPDSVKPGMPCSTCRTCRQILRMQQPDLSVLQAEEGGTFKVDQVRELQHTLALTPYESRYRFALLLNFERATTSAQNALLKILEEAPPRVILVLTADASESLLPTIASRCEILRLRPLSMEKMSGFLQNVHQMPEEEAHRLAHLAAGRPGYALRLLQSPELRQQQRQWVEDLFTLLPASRRERFAYASRFGRGHLRYEEARSQARLLLQVWLLLWRDVLFCALPSALPLTNLEWTGQITRLAEELSLAEVRAHAADLEQALEKLELTNVNIQLMLEVLLLDWPRLRLSAGS